MIFQPIGEGKSVKFYTNDGKIIEKIKPQDNLGTWKYNAGCALPDNVQYAHLYAGGKEISQACPECHLVEWSSVSQAISHHYKAMKTANVCLDTNCFFDLIPVDVRNQFFNIKNKITKYVIDNYKKPSNYDFLLAVQKLLECLSKEKLNICIGDLRENTNNPSTPKLLKLLSQGRNRIIYDQFKSRTGRLTTKKESFPILNLHKGLRSCIKPNNDFFIEYDFNAAEARTLFALSGNPQPSQDIHEWNMKLLPPWVTREEAKETFFAWLYNPNSNDQSFVGSYDKSVYHKYWKNGLLNSPFGRNISVDESRALNYLLQSTTNDIMLENAAAINDLLASRKSRIAFTMHDSLVVDYCIEDKELLEDMENMFSETRYGKYKTNVSIGRHFGEMRKIR